MNLSPTRDRGPSVPRHASPYLLSAACVLLGGYLLVRDAESVNRLADLAHVFGTQIAYSACLLAVGAYLLRVRGRLDEGYLLLALVAVFALDALGLQHLYPWEDMDGVRAAWMGGISGVLLMLGGALALGFPAHSRLTLTALACVVFIRCEGFLLVDAPQASEGVPFAPRHVALGWLLAVAALPALALPRPRSASAAIGNGATVERVGIFGCLALASLHFVAVGNAFALPFRAAYLAPLLILLPAVVERLVARARVHRWSRLLLDLGPLVALALTATEFSPSLLEARWANRIPLAAFFLALVLTTVVTALRAARLRHVGLAHLAVGLGALAILGGDMPEVLARLRFPAWWQALAVAAACWGAIAVARRFEAGVALHGLASFASASWLAETFTLPWSPVFVVMLVLGFLAHAHACGVLIARGQRVALAVTAAGVSLVTLALAHDELPRLALALAAAAFLAVLGRWMGERVHVAAALALASASALVKVVGVQVDGDIPAGRLLIELGFVLLLLGVLNSIVGGGTVARFRQWWQASG